MAREKVGKTLFTGARGSGKFMTQIIFWLKLCYITVPLIFVKHVQFLHFKASACAWHPGGGGGACYVGYPGMSHFPGYTFCPKILN